MSHPFTFRLPKPDGALCEPSGQLWGSGVPCSVREPHEGHFSGIRKTEIVPHTHRLCSLRIFRVPGCGSLDPQVPLFCFVFFNVNVYFTSLKNDQCANFKAHRQGTLLTLNYTQLCGTHPRRRKGNRRGQRESRRKEE